MELSWHLITPILRTNDVFNLGRSKSVSIEEVANLVAGQNYPREYGHERIGEADETLSDNNKANKILGWKPSINLETGILEILTEEELLKN